MTTQTYIASTTTATIADVANREHRAARDAFADEVVEICNQRLEERGAA